MYYICSENIGTGQLRNKISCAVTAQLFSVFCFSYAKGRFFHDVVHIFTHFSFLRGLATSCGWLEIKTFTVIGLCLMKIGKLASAGQLCLM